MDGHARLSWSCDAVALLTWSLRPYGTPCRQHLSLFSSSQFDSSTWSVQSGCLPLLTLGDGGRLCAPRSIVKSRCPSEHPSRATTSIVAPITKKFTLGGRSDGQWGMPPLSAYTPFESLLFFQSLAALDARPASFAAISDSLRSNAFIRQNGAFDASRLTPEALEELYNTLMQENLGDSRTNAAPLPDQNGHRPDGSPSSNPKKRKLTNPMAGSLVEGAAHTTVIPSLVSHLYARYKERVTKEIRSEEKRYKEIRDEIDRLQKADAAAVAAPSKPVEAPATAVQTKAGPMQPQPMDIDIKQEAKPVQPTTTNANVPAGVTGPSVGNKPPVVEQGNISIPQLGKPAHPQPPRQNAPPMTAALPSQASPINGKAPSAPSTQPPGLGYRVPSPDSRAANVGKPLQSQQPPQLPATPAVAYSADSAKGHPRPEVVIPTTKGAGLAATATQPSTQPGDAAARKAPVPGPSPAPQYPVAQQQFQQWTPQRNFQTEHPQVSPYVHHPYPNQSGAPMSSPTKGPQVAPPVAGRAYQGPYPPAGPMTPGAVPPISQSPRPGVGGLETPGKLGRTSSFPSALGKRPPRPSIDTSGSLTPWKRSPVSRSPGSPVRPRPEDVSPISEKAPSPFGSPEPAGRNVEEGTQKRRRKGSLPPPETEGRGARFKTEQKGRTRRDQSTTSTRSRGRSVASRDDDSMTDSGSVTRKIKQEMPSTPAGISEDTETENRASARRRGTAAQPEEGLAKGRAKRKRGASESIDADIVPPEPIRVDTTQYVLCTRNFPRTGAPIMNDVTAHKHASIFAKPLTERDAPGYKDLIYRPQDLKSIKSAIHQGSKAVAAATEAASTPAGDGESPAPGVATPSKNTVLMLQKTADLIPPKGIVNSAQLEKELIRMFANAIMFNPTPERSFGPAFPMITDSSSRESSQFSEAEEGGIIHDTREMCDDVEKAVTRWRAAERTADELGNKSILTLRRGSDVNMDSSDETKG
ncbi:predicted protein [Paecilomyces variotii No. 5]|uniref:Bromo domain-containing protein n=1 Tax=Byssochlamys spectabilis (strain No. 5 / NBRC 109023) TaxID=1356009 RepID=V5FXU2_BYSSN|nr:predicted protein [Paecilomyces variotii No. 5]